MNLTMTFELVLTTFRPSCNFSWPSRDQSHLTFIMFGREYFLTFLFSVISSGKRCEIHLRSMQQQMEKEKVEMN